MKPQCHFKLLIARLLFAVAVMTALNFGPTPAQADWPPLNPNVKTFFVQHPDPTTNGMDVLACPLVPAQPYMGTTLADDWICRGPSPVTDIHIWGSWLTNRVDPNTTFLLAIYSDVPAANGQPSHPGALLWSEEFLPGRYKARLWSSGVTEQFLNPAGPGFMGSDNQIWQYNFYLKNPFYQQGQPQAPIIYWLSVMAKPSQAGKTFGWKTTRDHFNDAAVFSQVPFGQFPGPGAWSVIKSPAQKKLELAFAMTSSQVWAVNKNFYNLMPFTVSSVRVRLPGPFPIMNHFDGPVTDPWTFNWEWDVSTNTVLNWVAPVAYPLQPNQCIHTGFMGPGIFPPLLNWGWWDTLGGNWLGNVLQIDIGWPRVFLPSVSFNIGITNIQPQPPTPPPFTNYLYLNSLKVEYHTNAVPLEDLNDTVIRAPTRTVIVPIAPAQALVAPGANVQFPMAVPDLPMPHEQYAVVIPQFSPVNTSGEPVQALATTDWYMLPAQSPAIDPPTPPPLILTPAVGPDEVTLTWTAMPGVIYQVQSRGTLDSGDSWLEEEGNVIASDTTATKTLPLTGGTSFYRVVAVGP